ncbi:hypothetical protein [Desulforhopalus sp. IMCC35007]|nr:hypothetical protein [Desulforhopalus sp. IMCC35007]
MSNPACKKCEPNIVCKVDEEFLELAEKIKTAEVLVIGGYSLN